MLRCKRSITTLKIEISESVGEVAVLKERKLRATGDLIVKSFGSKLNRNSVGVSPNSGDIKVVTQSGKDSRQFVGINFGGALKFIFGIEVNLKLGVKF